MKTKSEIRKVFDEISLDNFLSVWNRASSLEEAALGFPQIVEKFGIEQTKLFTSLKACLIRKNNPKTKQFQRGRPKKVQVL